MFLHRSNNSRLDLNNQLTEKSVRYVRECRLDHWRWKQTLLKVLHSFRDSDRQSGNILSSWLQLKTLLELLQNLNQRSRSGTSLTADWTGAASSTSSTEMSSIQEAARRALIHSGLGLLPHLQNRFDRTHSMFSESCSQGTRRNETSPGCTCLCALCFYLNNLHNNCVLLLSPMNRTRSWTEVLVCGTSWDAFPRLFPQMFYSRLVSSGHRTSLWPCDDADDESSVNHLTPGIEGGQECDSRRRSFCPSTVQHGEICEGLINWRVMELLESSAG